MGPHACPKHHWGVPNPPFPAASQDQVGRAKRGVLFMTSRSDLKIGSKKGIQRAECHQGSARGSIEGTPTPRCAPSPLQCPDAARLRPFLAGSGGPATRAAAEPYAMRLSAECNENKQTCHNAKAMDDRPVAQIAQRTINQVIEHLARCRRRRCCCVGVRRRRHSDPAADRLAGRLTSRSQR